ncbi:PP2C family protein-serine/threonine phosphatase [Streptomyces meridianus]|uniref:Serine/threonine-protein phosphatase n=1 Tax=Streptomyces meridianus TaxID=2938945 RepID=A0ABT0XDF8_9ACTN|nr:PP2C family protein-serine/threonine phosphatase [Streptomyces meridianus]MCM2580546.1 serine/threonine-protein phosphatase [Streptomyces meridianus]
MGLPVRQGPETGARYALLGQRIARLLPGALIVGGLVFEFTVPVQLTAAPFFSAAPMIAAPLFTFRGTVVTGTASVIAILGLHAEDGTFMKLESLTELITVLTVAVLALFINTVVRRRERSLASARDIAEAAQRAVLPTPPARTGGLRVAARYEAAVSGTLVGGDLYAVQSTPFGVRMIVGDVRGKGLGAVEVVAVLVGAFREAAEEEPTLDGLARRLERALRRDTGAVDGLNRSEGFTTAVLAEAAPDRDVVRLYNRGHPPPLLLSADGGIRVAEPAVAELPLGLGELGAPGGRVDEFRFPPGCLLFLFTDGVTEARDAEGGFYDPQARMRGRSFRGPRELLDAVVADVARHAGGPFTDDMALLAVSRPDEGRQDKGSPKSLHAEAAGHLT